ncbi:MAG: ABC transporter ATP-binding protein [Methanomassiliicoccales archaeon]|nr:ABC transporter ATP-binding protein [Methanomassiliicoccales archaeon]MDD1773149.1 ABC transporter ATP-binding protein [Methanomassiliicoccales archaeon]
MNTDRRSSIAGPLVSSSGEGLAVCARRLRKEFDGIVAVSGLDLRIRRSVLYGLIGPNGSGKTTTIKMLVGLLVPSSGRAEVLGKSISGRLKAPSVGYMPQELAVYPDLTVHENLDLFAGLHSVDPKTFEDKEMSLLRMIDLEGRKDSLVSQLSGGMKHRVSLACALIHEPELLFLDEPTVGVDPELRVGFWDYFQRLKSLGRTIVLTTHYMDEAVRCDVVGMMRAGTLIAEGTPSELMASASASSLEDAFLYYARGALD